MRMKTSKDLFLVYHTTNFTITAMRPLTSFDSESVKGPHWSERRSEERGNRLIVCMRVPLHPKPIAHYGYQASNLTHTFRKISEKGLKSG